MKRQSPEQGITNYIDAASVDGFAAKAEALGGKVVMPRTAVPGMGYFALCLDTGGNVSGIWEDNGNAK